MKIFPPILFLICPLIAITVSQSVFALDLDGDELPDVWEDANAHLGYDKNNRWSFSGFPYGDDEEVYCEYQAFGTTGDSSKDWANPGKQSKNKF